MTRFLGIDLGERRIGLAIGEPDREPVRGLATIRRDRRIGGDIERLATVIREQRINELVVGLPLEARGNEGTMATAVREWAAAIGVALALPVTLRDERLSSHLAEERLGPMPRGRSGGPPTPTQRDRYRSRVDQEAAAIILEDELTSRAARAAANARAAGAAPDGSGPA